MRRGPLAKVETHLSIAPGIRADQLEALLTLARQDAPQASELRVAALAIDPSLTGLLDSFPQDEFWRALRCLTDSGSSQHMSVSDFDIEAEFEEVPYPCARRFADQWQTWLQTVGCRDVQTAVTPQASQSTDMNVLNLRSAYDRGKLVLFLGAGISRHLGLPLWKELLNRMLDDCGRLPG
ncbi:MAG: hypothetical protein QM757_26215 [Paludibaculum sp.]